MAKQSEPLIRLGLILVFVPIVVAVCLWVLVVGFGLLYLSPFGILGVSGLIGIGVLLFVVIRDRLTNEEDNYYSRNVDE